MSYRVIAHSRSGEVAYRGTEVHGSYGAAEAEARVVARRAGLTDVHIVKDGKRIVGEVKARSNPRRRNPDSAASILQDLMDTEGGEPKPGKASRRVWLRAKAALKMGRESRIIAALIAMMWDSGGEPRDDRWSRWVWRRAYEAVGGEAAFRSPAGRRNPAKRDALHMGREGLARGIHADAMRGRAEAGQRSLHRPKTHRDLDGNAYIAYDAVRRSAISRASHPKARLPNPDRFAAHEIEVISWPTPWHAGHYPKMSKKDFKDYVKLNGWSAEVMCHGMRSVPGSLRDLPRTRHAVYGGTSNPNQRPAKWYGTLDLTGETPKVS